MSESEMQNEIKKLQCHSDHPNRPPDRGWRDAPKPGVVLRPELGGTRAIRVLLGERALP